ncbi:MAG: class I SAM-dependent methyltransferase [Gaiellaceae bacterium]
MLRAEAAWLADRLEELPSEALSPLLSIGSGDARLRTTLQPWIEGRVYAPLARRQVRVLHHDLEPTAGVDVAGDLTDPEFLGSLDELNVRSVICCNVLEHVPDPAPVASAIERTVAPGGYLLVTVPSRYPYHPGPIDTLFRPTVEELRLLFPTLTVMGAAEIRCESLIAYLLGSPTKWASLAHGVRTLGPHRESEPQPQTLPFRETARMMLSSTSVSGVVLRASG